MPDAVLASLLAFTVAAALLTVTPGLDTALMLRTSATDGAKPAAAAGAGILAGCIGWSIIVAAGLGALLAASQLAYTILKWAGALYLAWLGLQLLLKPRRALETLDAQQTGTVARAWFRRGFLTNILNPKVGIFYVSFLPQFIPAGADVRIWAVGLALIHVALSVIWFGFLIALSGGVMRLIRRPGVVTALDRLTGGAFVAFAARLVLEPARA